jgi:multidrug efflux system membrane fusion protein
MKRFTTLKSGLMAIGVALAVILWMLSGLGRDDASTASGNASEPRTASRSSADSDARRPRVTVEQSRARVVTREIAVSARTEPNRRVEVRAETDGRIVALGVERGRAVSANEGIVRLDLRDRNARLEQARALIAQRELEHQAALRLQDRQLVSEVQTAEANANLVRARADLEQIELDLAYTNVRAPFDAVLDDRFVEIGDYVSSGDSIARLVDTEPLIVEGEVSEREVMSIEIGGSGTAKLINGQHVDGRIRYLAPVADTKTRTIRVELAVPNSGGNLRAGMSAEMILDAEEITAHSLSPALLTLDDTGVVGVKSVDADGVVAFHPVEIVSSSSEGVLVTGLPKELQIITVGQGFVTPGQRVDPVYDPALSRERSIEHTGTQSSDDSTPRS